MNEEKGSSVRWFISFSEMIHQFDNQANELLRRIHKLERSVLIKDKEIKKLRGEKESRFLKFKNVAKKAKEKIQEKFNTYILQKSK